jgi:hypothetical protein
MKNDKKVLIGSIIGGMIFFSLLIGFIGQGNVRQVPIFFKEHMEATVAFRNIDGETKIVGLKGNAGINPTLVMRTGDFAYILTVINQDTTPHMFYVDGLEIHTKALRPGENDTVTIYSKNPGTYNYYDRIEEKQIGKIKAVKVGMLID